VDVREPDEWATGHVPGARNVPLGQIAEHLDQLRQVPDLLLVCRSGNRSGQAQRFLEEQGVAATNVAGGLRAWAEAGLPLEP
jgi:rhodanese-related sulfurtransferase